MASEIQNSPWVARGLSWFHYICNLHVVHLNISAECVLLDKNFEPKISNFGKAKFMHPNIEDGARTIFYVSDGKKNVNNFVLRVPHRVINEHDKCYIVG